MGLGDRSGHGEGHRDGVFGSRAHVPLRCIGHDDALGRRRLDIDVVDPDARPPDDHEVLGGREHLRRYLGA